MDWEKEVIELHDLLGRWLSGELDPTDANFDRFARVHAEDFSLVTVDGELLGRGQLLDGLRAAHGARPGLRVRVEDARVLYRGENLVVVGFGERHRVEGSSTMRLTTAVLRRKEGNPNGLEWLRVHETRTPEQEL